MKDLRLIPYLPISFPQDAVAEIVLGNASPVEQPQVETLLKAKGYRDVKVTRSNVLCASKRRLS